MKRPDSEGKLLSVYEKIHEHERKYGKYHKTILHLHTPESYDYTLKNDWDARKYQGIEGKDLYDICVAKRVINPQITQFEDINLDDERKIYKDKKEFLSFLLLAGALLRNKVEIAVIMDHNTTKGIDKIKEAIKELRKFRPYEVYTEIISGVEISCADKIHVGIIFEDGTKDSAKSEINNWLEENLLNIQDGSFRTSYDVMEELTNKESIQRKTIAYIAHINTSEIFKATKFLSGGYKSKLLRSQHMQLVGINSLDCKGKIAQLLRREKIQFTSFLLDNDSHDIDNINKNLFWIKGDKICFSMIREALLDYDVSVQFEDQQNMHKYISGMYVEKKDAENFDTGFLTGENGNEEFITRFSESLNCFIGGRGTGKSTVLEMLEYVLSQRCPSKSLLEFLCKHGNVWVLYQKEDNTEYLIEMAMARKEHKDDNVLQSFGENPLRRYHYDYSYSEDHIKSYARDHYLRIYKVCHAAKNDKKYTFEQENVQILREFFDTKYSVNELVASANEDKITKFIWKIMFQNKTLSSIEGQRYPRTAKGLKNFIGKVQRILQARNDEVHQIIDPFNIEMNKQLQIDYSQKQRTVDPPIGEWIFGFSDLHYLKQYCTYKGEKYNIKGSNIIDYFLHVYDYETPISFIDKLLCNTIRINEYPLSGYAEEYTQDMVDDGIKDIKGIAKNNQQAIVNYFANKMISRDNVPRIIEYIKHYMVEVEHFDLRFNVNSHESSEAKGIDYKSIEQLSLGQKVVAMLDFVLGYSDYACDYRPLILDQPEDNLDSQYIYKNLVQQLRTAKNKRQIIIATHNATIVTNAMADQVCVMESDGTHGWIKEAGYPGEKKIKKDILNYLEGGVDSFKHKMSIYQDVL